MIPDFKGHHFVEITRQPEHYRCERCGMVAEMQSDRSVHFIDGTGITTGLNFNVPLETSHVPRCICD